MRFIDVLHRGRAQRRREGVVDRIQPYTMHPADVRLTLYGRRAFWRTGLRSGWRRV